jgi:hypothetical protein
VGILGVSSNESNGVVMEELMKLFDMINDFMIDLYLNNVEW